MNDTQILTLAISIGAPLSALVYGNWRIKEAKEMLAPEIRASKAEFSQDETRMSGLENKFSDFETKLDRGFERINQKLDTILKILTDGEARLPK